MAFFLKWRTVGRLASCLLIALALSCFSGGGDNYSPEGSLQVVNDGSLAMRELYITPSTSSTWGVDQLAPHTLQPGDSITLTHLYHSSYDVLAYYSDSTSDMVYDINIKDGVLTTLGMMDTGKGAVAVFNNSGLTIYEVYLTPSNTSTWGPNQTDLPIYNGEILTLTGIYPDIYDLRVVFSDGGFADTEGISVTSGVVTTIQVN